MDQTQPSTPVTAATSIRAWLDHPEGGPLVRQLLAASGTSEEALAPVLALPLQQLVVMSQGAMPQAVVDDLVLRANGGVAPEEAEQATGWVEQVTAGRFDGQSVVVTGAASGIGRAVASRVAREGGRVIAVDVNAERLAETARLLAASAGQVITVVADITATQDVEGVVAAATAEGHSIAALANVAGINDDFSPAGETSDAVWDRVLAVNLTGPFKLLRAALPSMLAAGRGSVVNVASEAGLRGNASGNAYTVSKHGVIGLTRSAAFMYGPQGVRVNAVAPGAVATGIPMPADVSAAGSARLAPFHATMPSVATAEQIAASITFVLSGDAVNVNGAVLASDGGWSVQ